MGGHDRWEELETEQLHHETTRQQQEYPHDESNDREACHVKRGNGQDVRTRI